ncbi:MAG: ABC transporter permease, partial [archaeon GB-1867-035]|nr:ABC transporter permease [Candidatus Culexmicrobium profundum]
MKFPKFLSDTLIIFRINILALRTALIPFLVISIVIPIGLTYLISLASFTITRESTLNYLIGALTLSLSLSIVNGVGQSIAQDKFLGKLEFYRTLPINPISYVLGVTLTHLIAGLINMMTILLIGGYLWGIIYLILNYLPIIIALSLTSCIALIGIGAIIGTRAKNLNYAYMYSNIISIIITTITPAYYPQTIQPSFIKIISQALPTTHTANILRILLTSNTQ